MKEKPIPKKKTVKVYRRPDNLPFTLKQRRGDEWYTLKVGDTFRWNGIEYTIDEIKPNEVTLHFWKEE